MLIYPNAKINLGLYITEKRADGYHNLETVFYPIPLRDSLQIEVQKHGVDTSDFQQAGITIEGYMTQNLVYKVYELLHEEFNLPPVKVHLYKHIPTGAGLGGGSSDAAFMMKGLNELFDLRLSDEQMEERVGRLGADCAFFIRNTPVYATGIGNVFKPCPVSLKGWTIVLIKPNVSISTKDAYGSVCPRKPEYDLMNTMQKPIELWRDYVTNDFEASVFKLQPQIGVIKDTLYDMGAVYASMSGSGSAVFGLFKHPVESVKTVFADCFTFQQEICI